MVFYDPPCLLRHYEVDAHTKMTPQDANGVSGFCAKNIISAKNVISAKRQQLGRRAWSFKIPLAFLYLIKLTPMPK